MTGVGVAPGVSIAENRCLQPGREAGRIRARWFTTIGEIPSEAWKECFGNGAYKSYAFQSAVEESGLSGVAFHYLCIERDEVIQAILPCFVFAVELDLLAEGAIAKVLRPIKKVFQGILTKKMFFVGTPVATCDHMWGFREQDSPAQDLELQRCAIPEIKRKTRSENCLITILKEIPASRREQFQSFLTPGFFFAESLPNSFILTGSGENSCLFRLRKKYRSRIRNSGRKFHEAGFTWEIRSGFSQFADRFEELYLQVLKKSHTKFERLNARFFRNVEKNLGDAAFCIIGRNREGRIVCFELVLVEKDSIIPMYLGIDYAYIESGDVYFNCIHRIVEEAEARDKRLIKLGQTSYEAKAYSGAVFERLFLAIDAPNPLLRLLLKTFSPMLFPRIPLPAVRSFRDEAISGIESELASFGIANEKLKSTQEEP